MHMQKVIIKRDGLPPISFTGELLAKADNRVNRDGNRANRWTEIEIYRTKGGRFIASIRRITCWQGESDHATAGAFATASEVIEFIKQDDGELGAVGQEAVEKAVKSEPAFADAWVEEVE
jgi:hypothetical protein